MVCVTAPDAGTQTCAMVHGKNPASIWFRGGP